MLDFHLADSPPSGNSPTRHHRFKTEFWRSFRYWRRAEWSCPRGFKTTICKTSSLCWGCLWINLVVRKTDWIYDTPGNRLPYKLINFTCLCLWGGGGIAYTRLLQVSFKYVNLQRDLASIPGLGRSPGERNGNPLQYCCLENPMDRVAWSAIGLWVTKTQTGPRD